MRKHPFLGISLAFCFFFCSGCASIRILALFTPTPTILTPTITPTPSETPTEVIEWFPASATPRPLRTPTAFSTPDQRPRIGKLLVSDSFEDDKNWQVFRSDAGNAVISHNELTLALQKSANTITSFSQLPQYDNYYLSMDVNLSMCAYYRDLYGVMFRVGDTGNLYRWLFNCRGESKVERFYKGQTTILSNWSENTYIRPGAPQKFSLGISASGSQLQFFINDTLVAAAEDTVLQSGGYGVLASSEGYTPLTVSFSNFQIYELR